jgi:hypothetical protein
MLAMDLLFVLLAARLTGGAQSPFLAQSYLIILAALSFTNYGVVSRSRSRLPDRFLAQYPFWLRSICPYLSSALYYPLIYWRADSPVFLVRRLKIVL